MHAKINVVTTKGYICCFISKTAETIVEKYFVNYWKWEYLLTGVHKKNWNTQ